MIFLKKKVKFAGKIETLEEYLARGGKIKLFTVDSIRKIKKFRNSANNKPPAFLKVA